jgi:hypothetical protein
MKILSPGYLSKMFLPASKFKRLIGVSKALFQRLLDTLSRHYFQNHSGRGRQAKLALCDLLFMTLKYWRQYVTQFELAIEFGVGEATVHDWIVWIENALIKDTDFHLAGNKKLAQLSALKVCIIDVTESPIQRPTHPALQKACYSGKKKCHTIKTQVIIEAETHEMIGLSFALGHTHDFTLFKASIGQAIGNEIKMLADSGYQGLLSFHQNSEIPRKKSKNHPLTKAEKSSNLALSKVRIAVENVNCRIKVFKIFSTKYRNRRKRFALRMALICGLINSPLF